MTATEQINSDLDQLQVQADAAMTMLVEAILEAGKTEQKQVGVE